MSLWVALDSKGRGSWWNPVQSGQRMVVNVFRAGWVGFWARSVLGN